MKSDFLLAITQLSAEKNLPKDVVIAAVEAALVSAYRKDSFTPNQKLQVKISPTTGKVQVWAEKVVVEVPSDGRREISLEDARKIKSDAQIDEPVMVEATPRDAGRIAAQTAKQVILQRLHEAEHTAIFEEYAGREGDIVNGLVQRVEPGQVIIDLGRTEAVLPTTEQVRNERYRTGQRLKVYLLEVSRTPKGSRVVVSRSHPNLLRRLFELEIPEVLNGVVEIKSIAREAGYRSKVAVVARQEGIDPVGCCVGLRGIRIQNIVNELNGEKLDVVAWNADLAVFIANALSPAQVTSVALNETDKVATVVVPDKQLSLAIGKEGQNARLAAKLSGWRIDIKNVSTAQAEKIVAAKTTAAVEAEVETKKEKVSGKVPVEALATELAVGEAEAEPEAEEEDAPVAAEAEAPVIPQEIVFAPVLPVAQKGPIRFSEEIPGMPRFAAKADKKKKKKEHAKERPEGVRVKKSRRVELPAEEGEEY